MRLEVRGVDHQPLRLPPVGSQCSEDLIEHSKPAPPDEAIINRLVRTVILRRVAPAQTVPDHEDDATDHPPIVDPGNPVR
jgi:hypothetical protein